MSRHIAVRKEGSGLFIWHKNISLQAVSHASLPLPEGLKCADTSIPRLLEDWMFDILCRRGSRQAHFCRKRTTPQTRARVSAHRRKGASQALAEVRARSRRCLCLGPQFWPEVSSPVSWDDAAEIDKLTCVHIQMELIFGRMHKGLVVGSVILVGEYDQNAHSYTPLQASLKEASYFWGDAASAIPGKHRQHKQGAGKCLARLLLTKTTAACRSWTGAFGHRRSEKGRCEGSCRASILLLPAGKCRDRLSNTSMIFPGGKLPYLCNHGVPWPSWSSSADNPCLY